MTFEAVQEIHLVCPQCSFQVASAGSGGLEVAGDGVLIQDSDLMRLTETIKYQLEGRISVACFFGQGGCQDCGAQLGYVEGMGTLSSERELLQSLAFDSDQAGNASVHQSSQGVVMLRSRAIADGVRRVELLIGPFMLQGSLKVPGLGVARCGGAIGADWLTHEAWVDGCWPELQGLILDGLH